MISIDLSGKTAVVTGGGQGLGKATSTRLAEAGACVAVNYFEEGSGANLAIAEQTANSIGNGSFAIEGDVRDRSSLAGMFDAIQGRCESIDIVVNNAAIIRDRSLKKMADEEWHAVIDTNLTGVYHACKESESRLVDGGRIVNMASISGFLGFFGQANYSSAKAGVVALTKVISKELARRNITVNAVAPGVALTEMGKSIPEENRNEMLKQIPLGRFAETTEIADAILFLCSPLATYITGQTIHVNGGWIG